MLTLEQKINQLQPGQEIEISRTIAGYCTAERSGDGKTLHSIRYTGNEWTVFRKRIL
ncbi:hypothetical protein GCM10028818_00140 [Spirosoma horti]